MYTYEDLLEITTDTAKTDFVKSVIVAHKDSALYKEAEIARDYFRRRNTTILQYHKLLYTLSGEAVPDNFSANYKFCNAFFHIFVTQEVNYLLGNGVTFENDKTKDKLGGDMFDNDLIDLAESSLWGGVAFGFFNLDHIDGFSVLEFAPLIGEEDGALHAGVRFWQIDDTKPLRATLYEEDGYTDYIWRKKMRGNKAVVEGEILHPKRTYTQIVRKSVVDGEEILDGENYPNFPIVPLWANKQKQTELTGLREKIDGYDLIQSGFANDLDDASQIYWTLQNSGGMDDVDLAQFIERMKVVKAATVDDHADVQAHTIDVPFAARQAALADIKDSLYRDAMALDIDKLTAGNITATAIEASYSNLDLKCDGFETCVTKFIDAVLELIGVEDSPTYKRNQLTNKTEETNNVLAAAQYLDDETILKHLPFLSPDEIDGILERKQEEEANRYENIDNESEVGLNGQGEGVDGRTASTDGEANPQNL